MKRHEDKHGIAIAAGDTLRFDDGTTEKVYATSDQFGNEDLGISASNEAYLRRHPDAVREYYSLSTISLKGAEILR